MAVAEASSAAVLAALRDRGAGEVITGSDGRYEVGRRVADEEQVLAGCQAAPAAACGERGKVGGSQAGEHEGASQ